LPPGDVSAWTALLARLAGDPSLARRLHGPERVRQMRDVCHEMMGIYRDVVGGAEARHPQVTAEEPH